MKTTLREQKILDAAVHSCVMTGFPVVKWRGVEASVSHMNATRDNRIEIEYRKLPDDINYVASPNYYILFSYDEEKLNTWYPGGYYLWEKYEAYLNEYQARMLDERFDKIIGRVFEPGAVVVMRKRVKYGAYVKTCVRGLDYRLLLKSQPFILTEWMPDEGEQIVLGDYQDGFFNPIRVLWNEKVGGYVHFINEDNFNEIAAPVFQRLDELLDNLYGVYGASGVHNILPKQYALIDSEIAKEEPIPAIVFAARWCIAANAETPDWIYALAGANIFNWDEAVDEIRRLRAAEESAGNDD